MKKKIFNALLLLSLSLIILITGTVTISFNSYYESTTFEQLRNEAQLVIKGIEDEDELFMTIITDYEKDDIVEAYNSVMNDDDEDDDEDDED